MNEEKKKVINLNDARKRIKETKKKKKNKSKKNSHILNQPNSNNPLRDKILYWVQIVLFLGVTVIILRKCGLY